MLNQDTYQADYAAALPGKDLPWLAELRRDAVDRFAAAGLPDRKVEAWRYTDLKPIREQLIVVPGARADDIPSALLPPALLPNAYRIVFTNGTLASSAPDMPSGVQLLGLAQAIADMPELLADNLGQMAAVIDLPLPDLNQAMSADGYVLVLDPGTILDRPIEVLFLNDQSAGYPRNLILAGENSGATVIEHYLGGAGGGGDAAYMTNAVTEIQAAAGAHVSRYKIQQEGMAAAHIATVAVQLASGARFENFDLNLGGQLARSELHVALQGAGAEANLNGIYLLRDKQHCDNVIHMDHVVGATNSQQDYRGILDDSAHGVFQGKIIVRPDAQGIEGHQLNKTLLLSDKSEIDCKPELEILADDVKCSHGATAGELDETGLFYLRTRGISEAEARRLLMTAFVIKTLDRIDDEGLRGIMEQLVTDWMGS